MFIPRKLLQLWESSGSLALAAGVIPNSSYTGAVAIWGGHGEKGAAPPKSIVRVVARGVRCDSKQRADLRRPMVSVGVAQSVGNESEAPAALPVLPGTGQGHNEKVLKMRDKEGL